MNSRCYLCLNETKYQNAFLCTNCFCKLQDYVFLACARCGNLDCSGCEKLTEFSKVKSAYLYKDILANILIIAKENNNMNMQKIFYELFFIPVKKIISNLIQQENYNFIIVSPLRKDRIFHGSWHPNIFYDEVLQYIYSYEIKDKIKPQILFPYFPRMKKKQSSILSKERKKNLEEKLPFELIFKDLQKNSDNENKKILLLDDVLTSGETSLICKNISQEYFKNSCWHLFTILRAPQT